MSQYDLSVFEALLIEDNILIFLHQTSDFFIQTRQCRDRFVRSERVKERELCIQVRDLGIYKNCNTFFKQCSVVCQQKEALIKYHIFVNLNFLKNFNLNNILTFDKVRNSIPWIFTSIYKTLHTFHTGIVSLV